VGPTHNGSCDAKTYPIAKKKMTLEYLRSLSHLRARTNTIASVSRIRNGLSFATHLFFQQHGFQYIHTPIITCSDCEGAGEMFQVSTARFVCPTLEVRLLRFCAPPGSLQAPASLAQRRGIRQGLLHTPRADSALPGALRCI
jgi:aspartyl/asparaginyl-tRNA synthetase